MGRELIEQQSGGITRSAGKLLMCPNTVARSGTWSLGHESIYTALKRCGHGELDSCGVKSHSMRETELLSNNFFAESTGDRRYSSGPVGTKLIELIDVLCISMRETHLFMQVCSFGPRLSWN